MSLVRGRNVSVPDVGVFEADFQRTAAESYLASSRWWKVAAQSTTQVLQVGVCKLQECKLEIKNTYTKTTSELT